MFIVMPVSSFSQIVGNIIVVDGDIIVLLSLFAVTILIVMLITFGLSYEVSYYIIGPLRDLLKKLR